MDTTAGWQVNPDATRAALVSAADACAGNWNLRGVLEGPEVTDADLLRAYQRLELAESGVAALARTKV